MSNTKTPLPSSGVAELIERLKNEGIDEGRRQADALVTEAKAQAAALLAEAKAEATQLLAQAEQHAHHYHHAAEQALRMSARDMVLDLKQQLSVAFEQQVARLVRASMEDTDFLHRLIRELLQQLTEDIGLQQQPDVEVLLPRQVVGIEELRQHPDEYAKGQLSVWIQSVVTGLLREGVSINTHGGPNIKLALQQQQMVVELSHEAVTAMLLRHLQPRFRALLEGVIR